MRPLKKIAHFIVQFFVCFRKRSHSESSSTSTDSEAVKVLHCRKKKMNEVERLAGMERQRFASNFIYKVETFLIILKLPISYI